MIEKPGDVTWYEYLYGDDAMDGGREEFGEEMASEVREALQQSELDESRYEVEAGQRPRITASSWEMNEKEDVVELRDVLREAGIGDESVGVYVTPRDSQGEMVELPLDHAPVDVEYTVFVNLKRNQEAIDGGAASALKG
ncbi:hypothetical protein [Natrinema salaciae]|uniref:Uncharacterized protein n=1 Tax=Natrinema salaciae TaxID=1186196 RepID=A0A1H9PPM6_9EURY|nr:hypothetical protein [Natrinema salaciae]SER50231.1 hypothetical protein SAMN04489841_3938 [Natrinema salaciae]